MNAKQVEYVVFDVETTGLSPLDGDRIIEIAAVKVRNGEIVASIDSLINPQRAIPEEAQKINKITEAMIVNAPTAEQFLPQITEFIGGGCLVGHNIKFDLDFLCYELSLIGRRLNEVTPAVDTLKLAKRVLPQLSNYQLSNLALYFGARLEGTHRALADVKLTVTVLNRLLDLAGGQGFPLFQDILKQFSVMKPNFRPKETSQPSLF